MISVFTYILNISLPVTILIAACILVRRMFRNMPKAARMLLWLLVAVRLVVPVSIESPFSLLPAGEYVAPASRDTSDTVAESQLSGDADAAAEPQLLATKNMAEESALSENPETGTASPWFSPDRAVMRVLLFVWLCGVAAAVGFSLFSTIRLRRRVKDAVLLREENLAAAGLTMAGNPDLFSIVSRFRGRIYRSEWIDTAFVLGIFRPRIYMPYGISGHELTMVLLHEESHIRRKDHLIKPVAYLIASVYWFNPLVWVTYILLSRDIELACDERVIRRIGFEQKKSYSQALLDLSVQRRYISACPVAFGEIGTEERVRNILHMSKTKKICLVISGLLVVGLAVAFLTIPDKKKTETNTAKSEVNTEAETAEITKESTEAATLTATEAVAEAEKQQAEMQQKEKKVYTYIEGESEAPAFEDVEVYTYIAEDGEEVPVEGTGYTYTDEEEPESYEYSEIDIQEDEGHVGEPVDEGGEVYINEE